MLRGGWLGTLAVLGWVASPALAGVGDPQVRTDHPWYPGELACSTFPRLQATQAETYRRVVGMPVGAPLSNHQKALASWLWRNTHYWHEEEGAEDLWGLGWGKGPDLRGREYWTGLFSHGFGLCGTTHSQWVAEMNAMFGHGRSRTVGTAGHNSFEVFLDGGDYGAGKWVLLDHDLSTVVFDDSGRTLLSIREVMADWKRLTDRRHKPEKQQGWLVSGLAEGDGAVYADYNTAEYLSGYAGPTPMVHLRRGESLRRYLDPGLEDGKTFVYWGRHTGSGPIWGPERGRTWVNQPEKMFGSRDGSGFRPGQARYANAVFTYQPDFASGDYREGTVDESDRHLTLEWQSPYLIGATPREPSEWGIYQPGARNGLVLRGKFSGAIPVSVSVDRGRTWKEAGMLRDGLDLTDQVKGFRQYRLRIGAGAATLRGSGLTLTTVCQANSSVLPRLKDGGSTVHFEASGQAVVSVGPTVPQTQTHVVEGQLGTPRVTLELRTPHDEPVVELVAAAHIASSNPPNPVFKYQIEYSVDGGKNWQPVVRDWTIARRGDEPRDFWSQSMCWGSVRLPQNVTGPVRVRFRNDGGKNYLRAEAHLVYRPRTADATRVTFAWTDTGGEKQASQLVRGAESWTVPTGRAVRTRWVEFRPVKE